MKSETQILEVWGELACFTRPELKVERFSYPVITPSAARGIFDSIFCKPSEFRWQVRRVEVLSSPSYVALRRNEVKDKANVTAVLKWISGKGEPEPIWADGDKASLGTDMKGRTQRQTMALTGPPGMGKSKGIHYRIHAGIQPWPSFGGSLKGLEEQFRRRARRGQCFQQPYFGCREFPAYFRLVEERDPQPPCVEYSRDLGLMLYDVFNLSKPGTNEDLPFVSLFRAQVEAGVMEVPEYESDLVLKPGTDTGEGG